METWRSRELGILLKNRRQALNISARQLAQQAGLDSGTVLRIEHGQVANPGTGTLQALAKTLGLPLSDLFAAGSPRSIADQLPTLAPYLRTKYPHLSEQAVGELGHYFDYLQDRYGEHRPAKGDDER